MQISQNKKFFEFGEFRLDVRNRLLWRGDEEVALNLKEFELLLFLVENAGEVIEKNRLLEAVWKDVYIEEGTLTRNISRLRKKLEAETGGDKIIETLPKRGYRFLPRVEKISAPAVVVEERTTQHIRIEETFEFDNAAAGADGRQILLPVSVDQPAGNVHTIARAADASEAIDFDRAPAAPLALAAGRRSRFRSFVFAGSILAALLIFAFYFFNARKPEAKIAVAPRVLPLTGALGRENMPAFSPDGKQLVFAWNGGERADTDIYVRLAAGGESVRLTDSEFTEQYPAFTPDGSQIAFVRSFADHGEVVMIPALGGSEKRICRLFSGFGSISFAPDGKTLAVIDTDDSADQKPYGVQLVSVETGERRRLNAPGDYLGETTPRFSPDGKQIALVRVFGNRNQDLFVAPADGGAAPRRLTFDQSIIHSVAWSPDGQYIYFVSLRGTDQANVWRVPSAGGDPELIPASGKNITNIAIAPDGKTLAFVDNAENMNIWQMPKNQPAGRKLIATTYNEHSPDLTSDASRLAFVSNRTGKEEIWTSEASGKNPRQVTSSDLITASPRFSPDNTQIAFEARAAGSIDIFAVASDGGAARRVTTDAADEINPIWSSDGKWLYFLSNRTGSLQIWKIAANGEGEMIQVSADNASQIIASAPGNILFYVAAKTNELRRLDENTSKAESVYRFAADTAKNWAPAPGGIYFLDGGAGDSLKLKFYDFSTGQIRSEKTFVFPVGVSGKFAADPQNGAFFYVLQDQNSSSIFLAGLSQ